jgi:hypothetical protein
VKNFQSLLAAAACAACASMPAIASASPAVNPCDTHASVIATRGIDFGKVLVTGQRDTWVAVTPDSLVYSSDDATVRGASAAELRVCGPAGARFEVRIESGPVDLARGSGAALPHAVERWEAVGQGVRLERLDAVSWRGQFDERGLGTLRFGATLRIPARGGFAALVQPIQFRLDPL